MKLAQKIKPIVYVGKAGPNQGVAKSLNEALAHHELVKVRFIDFKAEKKDIVSDLAQETESEIVQIIGNVAVLYRTHPDPDKREISLPANR